MSANANLWEFAAATAALDEPLGASLKLPIQARRRRSYTPAMSDGRARLHLVDDDGMRRWVYEPPAAEKLRRRAGAAAVASSIDALLTYSFADPTYDERGPNRITSALVALDARLTPDQGLRQWNGTEFVSVDAPTIDGKTLLLIHGTFSNCSMFTEHWASTQAGQDLWKGLQARYPNILAFNHPTLSVGAWLNALDLHLQMRNVKGRIDIVTHSRGGLVACWWLRLAPTRVNRVIFVASPLDGTSLASPYRLRAALDHLATISDLLAAGGEALSLVAPMAAGAAGLAKIFGRVLKLGASVPTVDAVVAMVPGLASQQRTTNSIEAARLFADKWLGSPSFAVISANFEPSTDAPLWKVWPRLKTAGAQIVAGAADAVFTGPNDLVVDCDAMSYLGTFHNVASADVLDLGSCNVYHTSYFREDKVSAFLGAQLK